MVGTAAVPSAEKLLGNDTLGLFTTPDWSKASGTYGKWPASQLWNDPSMKPFKDKFMGRLKSDIIEPLEREFGVHFSDFTGLAQGQVTLAVTQNGWGVEKDQVPGFIFLLDARDKSPDLRTNLVQLKKKWVDSGKVTKSETIRGVEFTTLIFSTDDLTKTLDKAFPDPEAGTESLEPPKRKKEAAKLEWLIGQSESLLILGNSAKEIEKLLIRQSGGSAPSLAEEAVFAAPYASMFRDALTYGWVNFKLVMEVLDKQLAESQKQQAEANPLNPGVGKILSALGLSALESLSFNVLNRPDGCQINTSLRAPENKRSGLLNLFTLEHKEAGPPSFVPEEALKFSRTRLDLQKVWNTLETTLTEISPQMAGVIKLLVDNAGKDKDPNFDLRKNLIANLGDDIITYQKAPREQTLAGLASPPSLFLVGSPRADQLVLALKALSSLMPQASAKVKEREFLGRTIYTIALPTSRSPDGKQVENNLHFVASGSYVAFSTDVGTVEEYLRGSSRSSDLRATPGLAEAAEKVGGMGTGLFGYENDRETMRAAFEILKKESGTLANLFGNSPLAGRLGVDGSDKKLKDWVDFSLLPPFDKIAKYFYFSVYSGSVDAQGFHVKFYSPHPPQLN
jgi:hypothetical protein